MTMAKEGKENSGKGKCILIKVSCEIPHEKVKWKGDRAKA